jgi:hypothetical protein
MVIKNVHNNKLIRNRRRIYLNNFPANKIEDNGNIKHLMWYISAITECGFVIRVESFVFEKKLKVK